MWQRSIGGFMVNWRKPAIYTLLYLSGSKIPKYLKEIRRVEKLSKDEAKKYQEEKLKRLLLYAYRNVPYYNKTLKEAKVFDDGKVNLNNFNKIPILTKDIIRKEGKNLYSKEKRKGVYENTSGGSTGEPVRFLQDKKYNEWNITNKLYYKLKAGQGIGEKELRFWGSERDLLEGQEKLSIRLRNWLYNRREFNTFKMSEKQMFEYVEKWNKFNPSWVECYVQSIYEFAKFVEKNNLRIKSPKNGILTSAGTLTAEMREKIEKVFGCKVYNRYGSREVGDMACGTGRLKISFWHQLVEAIEEKNNLGKIIVTNLNSYAMPLIRYEIGDVGIVNGFEIEEVKGRVVNLFKTKAGDLIDGEFFTHEFYLKDWVGKFQVVQKDYELIEIKIVGEKNKKDMQKIEKDIKKVMGQNCNVKWEFVDEIEPTKEGKYLYTVSEVE